MKKILYAVVVLVLFYILLTPVGCEINSNKIFKDFEWKEYEWKSFDWKGFGKNLFNWKEEKQGETEKAGALNVHFIDVGQGDSTFIELPCGETMLIDAGEWTEADDVIEYIKSQGANRIDYLIGTHPHSDHIGGLADVVNEFEIGKIYMPKASNATKTFERLLDAIEENNVDVYTAKADVVIYEDNETKIEIVAPVSSGYESLNDYSAVIRLMYGETSFLFMGDAEALSENEIKANISSNVLKVGHHGSKTSSSKKFLYRVMPEIAVISVGEDNDYGHPSKTVLNRLDGLGAKILRTDECGDIVIQSDGSNIIVKED